MVSADGWVFLCEGKWSGHTDHSNTTTRVTALSVPPPYKAGHLYHHRLRTYIRLTSPILKALHKAIVWLNHAPNLSHSFDSDTQTIILLLFFLTFIENIQSWSTNLFFYLYQHLYKTFNPDTQTIILLLFFLTFIQNIQPWYTNHFFFILSTFIQNNYSSFKWLKKFSCL